MSNLMKFVKIFSLILLIPLLISCAKTESPTERSAEMISKKVEGKNFYLMQNNYTCVSNSPEKTVIKSWKNRIEIFEEKEVLIWGDLCNDQAEVVPFSHKEFSYDRQVKIVSYKGENYQYFENKPKLCDEGWWCPVPLKK